MKIKVMRPVEIEIAAVRMILPVRYGEEDIPNTAPGRKRAESGGGDDYDTWDVTVEVDTGRIRDWPGGDLDLFMKVCDGGSYFLLGPHGEEVAHLDGEYVPDVIPGEYGDYVKLDIVGGIIMNWPKNLDFHEFFELAKES